MPLVNTNPSVRGGSLGSQQLLDDQARTAVAAEATATNTAKDLDRPTSLVLQTPSSGGIAFTVLTSTVGKIVDIKNLTGTDLEFQYSGATGVNTVRDGESQVLVINANADELKFRRKDQSATQVTPELNVHNYR